MSELPEEDDIKGIVDTHDTHVEIKVSRDPTHGYRVWVHVGNHLAVRVYKATLILDGVELPRRYHRPDPEDDEFGD